MQFDDVVKNRKSAHSFNKKKVHWEKILEAIDAANQGPFANNLNNLRFLIVEEEEMIKKIAEAADQLWINEASAVILVCSDDKELESMFDERGRVYSRQQSGAAIITLIFKLTDLGVSSEWVGAYDDDQLRYHLRIPKEKQIEAIIPIGYEKEKRPKKKKKELVNTLYWEQWNNNRRPELLKEPKDPYSIAK